MLPFTSMQRCTVFQWLQRNAALDYIERQRLDGVVVFTDDRHSHTVEVRRSFRVLGFEVLGKASNAQPTQSGVWECCSQMTATSTRQRYGVASERFGCPSIGPFLRTPELFVGGTDDCHLHMLDVWQRSRGWEFVSKEERE